MNRPYVKPFNELGKQVNTITKEAPFLNYDLNRQQRRQAIQKDVFRGNKKGISLTVDRQTKHERKVQIVHLKNGDTKVINHYILR